MSLSTFLSNHFSKVISLNFAERPNSIRTFAQIENLDEFHKLITVFNPEYNPSETVIFLDEIQLVYEERMPLKTDGKVLPETMDLLTLTKPLVLDGHYRIALSGSLLGVSLNDVVLNPVGYTNIYKLYPLDFEEYPWARGVGQLAIDEAKECFKECRPVPDLIHSTFLDYFKEYVLVGGLPAAVDEFVKTKNLGAVSSVHHSIMNIYRRDISQYVEEPIARLRIKDIYQTIPGELVQKNKRFTISKLIDKSAYRNNNFVDDHLWLTTAGLAIPVYGVDEPTNGLRIGLNRKTVKLFLNDVGLLSSDVLSPELKTRYSQGKKSLITARPMRTPPRNCLLRMASTTNSIIGIPKNTERLIS